MAIGMRRRRVSECGSHLEPVPRHHMTIAEPEVEEVAVDEQRIAQVGHALQEAQEGVRHLLRGCTEVGIGDSDDGSSQHAAKIMFFPNEGVS